MDVQINNRMLNLVITEFKKKQYSFDGELADLISAGLIYINDCCFLRKCYEQQEHINSIDFIDKTSYECFINSIHIDDYVEKDFFIQSIFLIEKVVDAWRKININRDKKIKIILGETDFGMSFKFHIQRINENWIKEEEIENLKEEGILIFTSH